MALLTRTDFNLWGGQKNKYFHFASYFNVCHLFVQDVTMCYLLSSHSINSKVWFQSEPIRCVEQALLSDKNTPLLLKGTPYSQSVCCT